jgi:hypothetical protein
VVRGASARGEVSAEGPLASRPGAKSLQHSFSCCDQFARFGNLSSDELAIHNFEVALFIVATAATGNGAHIYEGPAQRNHLQALVPIVGRRRYGRVLPAKNSICDWRVRSSRFRPRADSGALAEHDLRASSSAIPYRVSKERQLARTWRRHTLGRFSLLSPARTEGMGRASPFSTSEI